MKTQTLERLRIDVVAEDSVEYDTPYLGQHGISLLLTAERGGERRRILVDVAQDPDALLTNMDRMGLDPTGIDMVVLTHCHYDHTQGVARVVAATGRSDVPVVAHTDLFRPHFITDPSLRSIGMAAADSAEAIQSAGGSLHLTRDPLTLMPGLTTTGEVPRRTDFEEVSMALFTLVDGKLAPDAMADDLSVVAHVADQGLVVVTGCSHAGIVNICHHARTLFDNASLHGIIGGFHLLDADSERIERTVSSLKEFQPDWICAGHCTGFPAQVALHHHFSTQFTPMYTGMHLDIGRPA